MGPTQFSLPPPHLRKLQCLMSTVTTCQGKIFVQKVYIAALYCCTNTMIMGVRSKSAWAPRRARRLIFPLSLLRESPTAVVVSWGRFYPPETSTASGDNSGCHGLGGEGVLPASTVECCYTPYDAQDRPPRQRMVQPGCH